MTKEAVPSKKMKKGLWLTKDNRLIVMEGVMNPLEYKILNYFMIQAVETNQLSGLRTNASKLISVAQIKATSYTSLLKKATAAIVKTSIHMESAEDPMVWEDYNLVSKMGYERGVITCNFNEALRPFVLGKLPSFTKSQYELVCSCSTYASMRLYEVCNSWKRTGMAYYEVERWRAMLGATNKSYAKFTHFKKCVMEPAIKEVNANTDLSLEVEYIKVGKAVSYIRVYIHDKKAADEAPVASEGVVEGVALPADTKKRRTIDEKIADLPESERECVYRMVKVYKLSRTKAYEYMQGYGLNYCREQMEYTRKAKLEGKMRNIGGFLKMALDEDYAGSHEIAEAAKRAEESEHKGKVDWDIAIKQDAVKQSEPDDDKRRRRSKQIKDFMASLRA
ncbi:replication initiation protein [Selenomonas sp. KH1T6]|uniref:replication initiation protein n=1 Tax=Selenomonas sp. KH1T6 TaxID=3158784 RepID=UPI0008A79CDF|nr:Initiator Replication protein [Selenomonas ruminantium]